ncbi:MAG: TetR family transcriptional regulator [Myxococcales bacterium]|nr:TetR family transcriptional regulator [Myxococcales bacterium]
MRARCRSMGNTRERLLSQATVLFADNGYDGASVRAICAAAGANLNAVSYHFGGKHGLYNAVIRSIGERHLASAVRILGRPPESAVELRTRLLLFAEEILAAWMREPSVLIILFTELRQGFRHCDEDAVESLFEQNRVLQAFLRSARGAGLLREDVDIAIVAGGLLERLNTQVMFADTVSEQYGASIQDPEYRAYWVRQVVDLVLHGSVHPRTAE